MKIKVLGTRGEIPESRPYHSKYSGILVNDELLLDVGEKAYLKLYPKWIVITHFHPDHAYFVRHGKEDPSAIPIPIYAPEIPSANKSNIHILDKRQKIGPYTITPIPTHHSTHVKSQGYVIKKGSFSFLYTSDLVWIDKQFHELIGKVNLVITEASFIRKGGMVRKDQKSGQIFGHNGVPNLISLLKNFSKNLLFTHFGSWFYQNTQAARQKLITLGKDQDMHIIVGYDGLVVNLNDFV